MGSIGESVGRGCQIWLTLVQQEISLQDQGPCSCIGTPWCSPKPKGSKGAKKLDWSRFGVSENEWKNVKSTDFVMEHVFIMNGGFVGWEKHPEKKYVLKFIHSLINFSFLALTIDLIDKIRTRGRITSQND